MSDLDRNRANRLMAEAGLDGLVLTKPEHVAYAIGTNPGVATMWRTGGGAVAIVPADPQRPVTAIVGDLNAAAIAARAPDVDVIPHRIWVDSVDLRGVVGDDAATIIREGYRRAGREGQLPTNRPETFSRSAVLSLLGDALDRLGLAGTALGLDLDFLPQRDFAAFSDARADIRWHDAAHLIGRLRAVKSPREITLLRTACTLAEAGLAHMRTAIRAGATIRDLSLAWNAGVDTEAARRSVTGLTGRWDYISVGDNPWGGVGSVTEGALIKADVGVLIEGYSSDTARSFVFGPPSRLASDIFAVMRAAHAAGLAAIRPGTTFGAVHAATRAVFEAAGFDGYDRGHFGHSLGADTGIEEWPFMSRDASETIEANMVLAFEVPFYADGLGALMIEDQLLVTDTGIELMSQSAPDLVVVEPGGA